MVKVADKDHFVHDPGLALLPGGTLVAVTPGRGRRGAGDPPLLISVSRDGGQTWRVTAELPYLEATPLVHEGRLYMFVQSERHRGMWFVVSDDTGETWSDPVRVLEEHYWNCQTAMVIRDGTLYWPVGQDFQSMGVMACDLKRGILNPGAWRVSPMVAMPIPTELVAGNFPDGASMA